MNKVSRQKIYKTNFLLSLFLSFKKLRVTSAKDLLSNFFTSLTGSRPIFLGRARAGLHVAVKIAQEKRRGICLISPLTILDVANMVASAGDVELYDLKKSSYEFDLNALKSRSNLGDVSTILITHYFYVQHDITELVNFCKLNNITLIEDCAISIGARYMGNSVGSYGDFAVYSFSLFKFLNNFWGGALICKADHDRERAKTIISEWRQLKYFEYIPQLQKFLKFGLVTVPIVFNAVFYLFRYGIRKDIKFIVNNIQNDPYVPYTGSVEENCFTVPHDSFYIEIANKISDFYYELSSRQIKAIHIYSSIKNKKFNVIPNHVDMLSSSFISYPIKLASQDMRDTIALELLQIGVDCSKQLYRDISSVSGYDLIPGSIVNVNELTKTSLYIPIHRGVNIEQINLLLEVLKKYE